MELIGLWFSESSFSPLFVDGYNICHFFSCFSTLAKMKGVKILLSLLEFMKLMDPLK